MFVNYYLLDVIESELKLLFLRNKVQCCGTNVCCDDEKNVGPVIPPV